jgi:hypothetical protein
VLHETISYNPVIQWPGIEDQQVTIGGVRISFREAASAADRLEASRTSAIQPVLRAAASPLASCDYLRASQPYLAWERRRAKTGRCGAAGRHVTKNAFIRAIRHALDVARRSELGRALSAFGTDERYAVAMAREAVSIRERAHAAALRAQVRQSVATAVASCALAGPSSCTLDTACGTGKCRFASGFLKDITIAAGSGRHHRPSSHDDAGQGFSDSEAVAAYLAAHPYRVGVAVRDGDSARSQDAVSAA